MYAIIAWVILSILGGIMLYSYHGGKNSLVKECTIAAGYILIGVVSIVITLAAFAFSLIAGIIVGVIAFFVVTMILTGGDIFDIF